MLIFSVQPSMAQPQLEDRSKSLPAHIYDGDWTHFVGGGVAVFDCNGDDLPDVFAAGGANRATLLVNDGAFTFEPATIPPLTRVTGAYPLDINGDGFTDLLVLRAGPNVVLRGASDCAFSDATAAWNVPVADQWSTAFTAWWDGGGQPTMAVGNYVDRADPDGPFGACDTHEILRPARPSANTNRQNADQITAPSSETFRFDSTPLAPGFCSLSMLAARDARGRPTLRISNDRHYYVRDGHEQMWDIQERRFLGPQDGWDMVSLWGMGIASRDVTADGRDEVMLTSMGDQLLQLAQPDGTYTRAPFDIGTYAQRPHTGGDGRPSTGWHAEFGDMDNDGRADLFIAKGNVDQMPGMATRDPNNLLMQTANGTFIETADTAGIATFERSRGAALADFDLDGRLDLIVVNRRAPLELYRNVTPDTGHWLRVDLQQNDGNRDAIGAVVTVQTDLQTQTVQRVIGGGHAGGQLLPLHFGLGDADSATVSVTWPDGSKTQHFLTAGATHRIARP